MAEEAFKPDDVVKSCCMLESGLFMAYDGLHACTRGSLMAPVFCTPLDIQEGRATKEFIVEKRKEYIRMLNDDHTPMDCKRCLSVEKKRYGDICFSKLGHMDFQNYTICNLRCSYCAYAQDGKYYPPQYDVLAVLRQFGPEDVEWNSYVDFAGGEPTLLGNLSEYLTFFKERRIRVMMHTNGVRYHQAIYDGLADGSIFWAAISIDAGTPSTYKSLRGGDYYLQVLENLCRYAEAGSRGKGSLVAKYIFCDSNCGMDDIVGFAYAMLAIRPQKVWLTFDFTPLRLRDQTHDFAPQIEAYARMYVLLKNHGLEAWHYFKEAVVGFNRDGGRIMKQVMERIEELTGQDSAPDVKLKDFRNGSVELPADIPRFSVNPLRIRNGEGDWISWSLDGKRVLLVPASPLTRSLLGDGDIQRAAWIGFVDRNPIQQGKELDGRTIHDYDAIRSSDVDVVLVAAPEKHRDDIMRSVMRCRSEKVRVVEYEESGK